MLPATHALFTILTCAYTSARSIGFCVIWVCISSSSSSLPATHYPLYDFDLSATHAHIFLLAALASVSFGFVLVRVYTR